MKIASIQFNSIWEDSEINLNAAEKWFKQAHEDGCDLIVFPEMFNTGFSMNAEKIAEEPNGESSNKLCQLAAQYNLNVIAGITEKQDDHFLNVGLYIDRKGNIQSKYIKNYPYSPSGEAAVYQRGNQSVIFDLEGISSSLFICYDLRFPELFRPVCKQVSIIFVIASWPKVRQEHWEALLKARAIENQCFVVGVNRIGHDGNNLDYTGGSSVYTPLGKCLSRGEPEQEYILTEIDISEVETVRRKLPFLEDMK